MIAMCGQHNEQFPLLLPFVLFWCMLLSVVLMAQAIWYVICASSYVRPDWHAVNYVHDAYSDALCEQALGCCVIIFCILSVLGTSSPKALFDVCTNTS